MGTIRVNPKHPHAAHIRGAHFTLEPREFTIDADAPPLVPEQDTGGPLRLRPVDLVYIMEEHGAALLVEQDTPRTLKASDGMAEALAAANTEIDRLRAQVATLESDLAATRTERPAKAPKG